MSVDQIVIDQLDAGAPDDGPERTGIAELDTRSWKARLIAGSRYLARHPGVVLALLFMFLVILSGIWPGLFTSQSPSAINPTETLKGPSAQHIFGTDALGRDMFSRVVHGSRLSLEGTFIAVSFGCVVGLLLGT